MGNCEVPRRERLMIRTTNAARSSPHGIAASACCFSEITVDRCPFSVSLTGRPFSCIYGHMKTTIDLPDAIFRRTKIAAARRRTTIKNLVIEGLEAVLRDETVAAPPAHALARLRRGYHLGGIPLTREEVHGR